MGFVGTGECLKVFEVLVGFVAVLALGVQFLQQGAVGVEVV